MTTESIPKLGFPEADSTDGPADHPNASTRAIAAPLDPVGLVRHPTPTMAGQGDPEGHFKHRSSINSLMGTAAGF